MAIETIEGWIEEGQKILDGATQVKDVHIPGSAGSALIEGWELTVPGFNLVVDTAYKVEDQKSDNTRAISLEKALEVYQNFNRAVRAKEIETPIAPLVHTFYSLRSYTVITVQSVVFLVNAFLILVELYALHPVRLLTAIYDDGIELCKRMAVLSLELFLTDFALGVLFLKMSNVFKLRDAAVAEMRRKAFPNGTVPRVIRRKKHRRK